MNRFSVVRKDTLICYLFALLQLYRFLPERTSTRKNKLLNLSRTTFESYRYENVLMEHYAFIDLGYEKKRHAVLISKVSCPKIKVGTRKRDILNTI